MEQAERKLQEREIRISKAGSIAEAALTLNGIFEAAQRAADDYLCSVKVGDMAAWIKDFRTTIEDNSSEQKNR